MFRGAGERSQHAIKPIQFETLKDSFLLTPQRTLSVPKSSFITISRPTLKRVDRGVFCPIRYQNNIGLFRVSHIAKPPTAPQARVNMGKAAQDAVVMYLFDWNFELISTAPPGSINPDVLGVIDCQKVQVEIKGTDTPRSQITVFDKSIRRGDIVPVLDTVATMFLPNVIPGEGAFERCIDYCIENIDSTVGFAEDAHTLKSGRMPEFMTTKDPEILEKVKPLIIDHLKSSGDTHFAVYYRDRDDIMIFNIDETYEDPIEAPQFPQLTSFALRTYGGPSAGATRVGIRITI